MLSHKKPDSVINVKVEFGEGEGKVPLDNIVKMDLCQYFGHKKLKVHADFFNSSSSFCWGVI